MMLCSIDPVLVWPEIGADFYSFLFVGSVALVMNDLQTVM